MKIYAFLTKFTGKNKIKLYKASMRGQNRNMGVIQPSCGVNIITLNRGHAGFVRILSQPFWLDPGSERTTSANSPSYIDLNPNLTLVGIKNESGNLVGFVLWSFAVRTMCAGFDIRFFFTPTSWDFTFSSFTWLASVISHTNEFDVTTWPWLAIKPYIIYFRLMVAGEWKRNIGS